MSYCRFNKIPPIWIKIFLFIGYTFLSVRPANSIDNSANRTNLIVTAAENSKKPESRFLCTQKIYAYVEIPTSLTGRHQIEWQWYRPDGVLKEKFQLTVNYPPMTDRFLGSWILLQDDSKRNILDEFSFGDYGTSKNSFAGLWVIRILMNNEAIAQDGFEVVCEG